MKIVHKKFHGLMCTMIEPQMKLSEAPKIKGKPGTERLSEQIDDILYGEYEQ